MPENEARNRPMDALLAKNSRPRSKDRLTGKVWGLSKKLSDLGKESNRAKILLQ